jgi:MFS family permease
MERALRRNIRLLYVMRVIRPFLLVMPVLVPFFQSHGLDQTDIYLLESAYALTIVAFEVPSGYLADRFSRKRSVLLGVSFLVVGFAIWSGATSFGHFLIGQILLGLGFVSISGADSAMAYDSYLALGESERYVKFEGRSNGLSGVSEAVASILGGLLVLVSLRAPAQAQTAVYALLVPLALLLKEPPRARSSGVNPFKDVLRITRYALHGHKEVKWLIFYGAFIETVTRTIVFLTQPYFQMVGIPLSWFGVLWATQLLALGLFSFFAHAYERRIGQKRALVSFVVIGVLSYLVLGISPSIVVLPAILGFYFVRALNLPILYDSINSRVESNMRATVLSVKSLAHNLLYAGIGPFLGVLVDKWSVQVALLTSAGIYSILGIVVLSNMKRQKLV